MALIPIASQDELARQAKAKPERQHAFILNLAEHWFTLRKFGGSENRWYNLNSVQKAPSHVSGTYLGMLLQQMENEGYSIFVVDGILPPCDADNEALIYPIPPPDSLRVANETASNSNRKRVFSSQVDDPENELKRAIAMSLGENDEESQGPNEDDELQKALKASLMDAGADSESLAMAISASLHDSKTNLQQSNPGTSSTTPSLTAEEMRQRRLERFSAK